MYIMCLLRGRYSINDFPLLLVEYCQWWRACDFMRRFIPQNRLGPTLLPSHPFCLFLLHFWILTHGTWRKSQNFSGPHCSHPKREGFHIRRFLASPYLWNSAVLCYTLRFKSSLFAPQLTVKLVTMCIIFPLPHVSFWWVNFKEVILMIMFRAGNAFYIQAKS